MWKVKRFKTQAEKDAWIKANGDRVQFTTLFVHNGYAVEYKPLRVIG
jgi:hypothetical protein